MQSGLTFVDGCVVVFYFSFVALVAFYVSGGQRTTRDYFLGGRSLPWWAAAFSIIATETSAVTLLGTPRKAYQGDWSFLQMVCGFVLGRLFLAFFFVQAFYRAEYITVYGLLERSFGGMARTVAAVLFLVGRVLGSGVRLYAGCLALEAATGIRIELAICLLGAFGTLYTLVGGIRAVVWTDILLGLTFMAGGVASALYIASALPGGLQSLLSSPELGAKIAILRPGVDLARDDTLLAGLAGGFVLTLATHGTDQDVVQRMLTCRDSRSGSLSVLGSAVMILPLMTLYLAVGTLLYFFYKSSSPAYELPRNLDHLFPVFVARELPRGFAGFVLAGLLAATVSSFTSVLNALASTVVSDFYLPLERRLGRRSTESQLLGVSRGATLALGAVLIAVAVGCIGGNANILDVALKTLNYFYGALLGAFLLAIFTRRGSAGSVTAGMVLSVPAVLVFQLQEYLVKPEAAPDAVRSLILRLPEAVQHAVREHVPPLAWPYWIIVGTAVTLAVGSLGRRGSVERP
ncbi:MAG TPA: sodium:solute symporter [Planctomycetota bacterium]|nr:sodium:solute symporter [Planctomycetota bacterium]